MLEWILNHRAWSEPSDFFDAARKLGLDIKQFEKDFHSPATLDEISADAALAKKLEADGYLQTAYYLDDVPLPSGWPVELLPDLIPELGGTGDGG